MTTTRRSPEQTADERREPPPPAGEYDPAADLAGSLEDCYRAIKARKAAGGPGWPRE